MSTAQIFLISDCGSAANFKAWGQGISTQLDSAGWTKTADTGQVVWASNPAVPSAGTWTVYEIRQPASDQLQTGSTKYYVRIDYGHNGSTAGTVRVTLGIATDGAGNFVGFATTPLVVNGNGPGGTGATTWECDFSWDASRLGVLLWRNASNTQIPLMFAIERTKTTAGADSTDGVSIFGCCNTTNLSSFQQTIVFGIGVSPQNQLGYLSIGLPGGGAATSLAFNGSTPVTPVFPCYGKWGNPATVMAALAPSDTVEGSMLTTTLYSATRTYVMTKTCPAVNNTPVSAYAILRYD